MSIANIYAVSIAFGNDEKETVHIESQDGNEPTQAEIQSLVKPWLQKAFHPSGEFEIEDITSVQSSIESLKSYSK